MGLNEKINNKVNKLHHNYQIELWRMIIVPSINHTHSCKIFENKTLKFVKILKYIDWFFKKACVVVVSQKNADNIIKALHYAFHILGVPHYLLSVNNKI